MLLPKRLLLQLLLVARAKNQESLNGNSVHACACACACDVGVRILNGLSDVCLRNKTATVALSISLGTRQRKLQLLTRHTSQVHTCCYIPNILLHLIITSPWDLSQFPHTELSNIPVSLFQNSFFHLFMS